MQIQLKQSEIVAAIKMFVSQQGINLQGKDVAITFTAGRKESGISADMVIDDIDLPDFGDDEDPVARPAALKVVDKPAAVIAVNVEEPLPVLVPVAVADTATAKVSLFS
jgi:hypothetical protein